MSIVTFLAVLCRRTDLEMRCSFESLAPGEKIEDIISLRPHLGDHYHSCLIGNVLQARRSPGHLFVSGATLGNDYWTNFRKTLKDEGVGEVYFIPDFHNYVGGPDPQNGFWDKFTSVDGMFNWEVWPYIEEGLVNVSTTTDQKWLDGARAAKRSMSTFQFKHIDESQNCIGEPYADHSEGESHYIGNIWPESIAGSNFSDWTNGFSHKAWQNLLPSLINAFKSSSPASGMLPTNNARVQGAFWYHPLLTTLGCIDDRLGKPDGVENTEDAVNIALISSEDGGTANGLKSGKVQVLSEDGLLLNEVEGAGKVLTEMDICNCNYYVVEL
ncbi:glycoside hydrolase family 71 protein [Atractiella rhizophila]|nr:glycoside hydrolase family 71 protein [Atractiella rhizophila]